MAARWMRGTVLYGLIHSRSFGYLAHPGEESAELCFGRGDPVGQLVDLPFNDQEITAANPSAKGSCSKLQATAKHFAYRPHTESSVRCQ